jgi:hypothetical protein
MTESTVIQAESETIIGQEHLICPCKNLSLVYKA